MHEVWRASERHEQNLLLQLCRFECGDHCRRDRSLPIDDKQLTTAEGVIENDFEMSLSNLLDNEFVHVGSWRTVDCLPHKVAWLKYQSGLYAFVVGSTVMYVGRATVLHRRLRNYSRRAFRDEKRALRDAHTNIALSVATAVEVIVYAKIVPGATEAMLDLLETDLIRSLQPQWNGTHRIR